MRNLGQSDLLVPDICLGTMTWGQQNTEKEAHEQLSYAVDCGVNFFDAAEMYPIPTKAETQGLTEQFMGTWLKTQKREDLIIASKVAGYSERLTYLREAGGTVRVTKENIKECVNKILSRLGTDYLDLLQIHWPDRYVALFGDRSYDPSKVRDGDIPFEEQLEGMQEVIAEGKVRHIGVSNETSWGVTQFVRRSEELSLPRMISIQNSYSLITRNNFETDLVEVCSPANCNVGLLAYSPLAGGILSGKYNEGKLVPGARLDIFPGYMERFKSSPVRAASKEYARLAQERGISPTTLALAFCRSRSFVTSSIIGATSMEQLRENIEAFSYEMDDELEEEVAAIYKIYRDPSIT